KSDAPSNVAPPAVSTNAGRPATAAGVTRHGVPVRRVTRPDGAAETPASPRRRKRRRSKYLSRVHPLRSVLTASAVLYLIIFLMPFLFASDSGATAVTLSETVRRAPAVEPEEMTRPPESFVEPDEMTRPPEPAPQASEPAQKARASETTAKARASQAAPPEPAAVAGELDENCYLRVLDKKYDEVSVMSMQEYLVCVLRGEMPGYFELEALKAQAVAARTYTRYMIRSSRKHGDRADICTSPACCQAYLSAAAAKKKWGYLPDDEERKIRAAVVETDGETMLYDGQPILAVFHASAAGVTRTSSAVWSGDDKPYLQPVPSPENGDNTPNYYSHVDFSLAQLQDKLRSAFPKANLSGDASGWLTGAERDDGGNIITMYVGGIKTTGSKVRSALGLRSACFTWEYGDGKASFYVTGYGHGVGLSQYGANQMAKDGASYREILSHYYTGIQIGGYNPD
ncbi:MAG: stage II sporulation protein D, partial [Oscillibacter sp.]|nr:stage II sporulation protein D [Oscillibacter sp.]